MRRQEDEWLEAEHRSAATQRGQSPDELRSTQLYERAGQPMELIQLMEQGLGLDAAHFGAHSLRIGGATALLAAGYMVAVVVVVVG